VHAIYDEHALAVIATDRDSSHLAEQLAAKAFVPVITLSSDRTLTSVNIPWIFRREGDAADALRYLVDAASKSGPNREALREVLAK
jgi:hypothetical protein